MHVSHQENHFEKRDCMRCERGKEEKAREMANVNNSDVGCFTFIRSFSAKKKKKPPVEGAAVVAEIEKQLETTATDCDRELGGGSFNTFAPCRLEKSRRGPWERLVMRPFFGRFSGRWLTFDLRKSESMVSIRVKMRGVDSPISTLYTAIKGDSMRRGEVLGVVRDRCLQFVHDVKVEDEEKSQRMSPPSLQFQCEKVVLLHLGDLPVSELPPKFDSIFKGSVQEVTVRVWPRSICPSCQTITMKLRPHISMGELQWMLCQRLSLENPSCLNLYLRNSLEPIQPNTPLSPKHKEFELVVLPSVCQSRNSVVEKNVLMAVSLIGAGINELSVHPNMTLLEFEQVVKDQFGVLHSSFLYIPEVFKTRRSGPGDLKMASLLDETTISLIDSSRRNFPIVVGLPSLHIQETYRQLPLYQMTIAELGLLKSAPLIVFEIRGPTIPLYFKTISNSNTRSSDTVFALVSVALHAVSINPDWSVDTLLKFIEAYSGFPCEQLRIGRTILSRSSSVRTHLVRNWLSLTRQGRITLSKDIPQVTDQ